MGTQLLSDVLRRDKKLRVVESPCNAEGLANSEINVAILFCNPAQSCEEFKLIRRVHALRPEIKFVALMDDPSRSAVVQAFRAGVRGIFCRSDSYKTLAKCVVRVHNGHVWASQSQIASLVEAVGQPFPMTLMDAKGGSLLAPREQDVVHWVAEGLTNREIADRMQLSEHTVKNYLFRIFDKLGVSTRSELVLYALSHVWPSSDPPRDAAADGTPAATVEGHREHKEAELLCPLAQLRLAQRYAQHHAENGIDASAAELAYVKAFIAERVSTALRDQSSTALCQLERILPAARTRELKQGTEEMIRKAVDEVTKLDLGSTNRVAA